MNKLHRAFYNYHSSSQENFCNFEQFFLLAVRCHERSNQEGIGRDVQGITGTHSLTSIESIGVGQRYTGTGIRGTTTEY